MAVITRTKQLQTFRLSHCGQWVSFPRKVTPSLAPPKLELLSTIFQAPAGILSLRDGKMVNPPLERVSCPTVRVARCSSGGLPLSPAGLGVLTETGKAQFSNGAETCGEWTEAS